MGRPTWPDALLRTDKNLAEVSKEIVYVCKGPRVVLGDMNHDLDRLGQVSLWPKVGLMHRSSLNAFVESATRTDLQAQYYP